MRQTLIAAALSVSALALCPAATLAQTTEAQVAEVAALGAVPKGRLDQSAVPQAYRLDLYVDPNLERYSGRTQIDVTLTRPSRYIDLHGLDLAMHSATAMANGQSFAGEWTQLDDTGVARLVFAEELPAGPVMLDFTYDAAFNRGPAGLFKVQVGEEWFAWSQLQSIDARQVFPSFDEPGFKIPFTVTLRTRPGHVAVSNTPEVSSTPDGDWTVHRFAPTKPLPTYLVAMMVGPFTVTEGMIAATPERPEPLPQRVVTTSAMPEKAHYALDNTAKIIPLLERYFASPYPFEKLDQINTPIMPGAMENAGAVLYGDNYLLIDESASTGSKQAFGMVLGHELGHQWFGDLVTPAWWDDIWLNESFANWIGYYIADQWRPDLDIWAGALEEGFSAMNTDALVAGRPIRQPITTNGQIDGAFDTITYGKGGHVIAMIAGFMGEEAFRDGVRAHLANHAYGNATGDDFFAALAQAAGDVRLVQAMKGFVEQQGVPLVTVSGADGEYTLAQQRYTNLGTDAPETDWLVPVCLRKDQQEHCVLLTDAPTAVSLPGDGALLPNMGGTGYYRFELPEQEWDRLIASAGSLKGGEAQAVADSLRASFSAGRAEPELLIALARQFAKSDDIYAFGETLGTVSLLNRRDYLTGDALAAYRQLVTDLTAPRLAQLGFDPSLGAYEGTDPQESQMRQVLVSALAYEAEDTALREQLARAAEAYLNGDEKALDPAFMGSALSAYAAAGDLDRIKALADRALSSQDSRFRPSALRALTASGDEGIASWLLNDFSDERLRPTEKMRLLSGVIGTKETRDFGIGWMKTHYADLAKQQGGIFLTRSVPYMLSGSCSAQEADAFAAQFGPQFAGTAGELTLARTLEGIRNCAALVDARGDAMREAVLKAVD